MRLIYKLSRRTMSSSNMVTALHYLLANTAQLTSPRNMITSVLGLSETSLPSIPAKQEIVFHWPASRHLNIPPPFPDFERVSQATLVGIYITPTISTYVHVNKMLTQINQRLYLLSQLKLQGLNIQVLHTLFTGLIMSKIMYALPAFAGQLTADDRQRMGAMSREALQRSVSHTDFDIDEIINSTDRKLFSQITQPTHCLYHLLPPKTSTHCTYSLQKAALLSVTSC